MAQFLTGRDGLAYSVDSLKTVLSNRSVACSIFGVPAPKFDSHESMKNWSEKQIAIFNGYIQQLQLLRTIAVECMAKTIGECPECDAMIE